MSNGPVEPAADMRKFAAGMRQIYLALTQEGFSDREALIIIGQMLSSNRPQQ